LVQVPGVGVGGTGQQTGTPADVTAEVQARLAQIAANKAAAAAARAAAAGNGGAGGGVGTGTGAGPGPFDVSSAIPNNFWGYVMLVVGMR
jgi:hypothetical protein